MLKAITLWQPWASLVMIGAKPYEFRKWDFRARGGAKVGDRVAIHAGVRTVRRAEVEDLLSRLDDSICSTGLVYEAAHGLLSRIRAAHYVALGEILERGAILGTVTLGEPKPSTDVMPGWKGVVGDSDRLEHCKWAWPMLDVRPLPAPIKHRGAQGFWQTSLSAAMACGVRAC